MDAPRSWADVHPALRLVRINNVLVSFFGTIVGGLVARGAGVFLPLSFYLVVALAGLSAAMVTAGGNVLNDLLDRDGDKVNHPDRPLVTGAISMRTARGLATALLIGAGVVVLPILALAPWLGALLVAAVGALLIYEFRFKALGLAGNVLVAFLTAAVFLYGGAAAGVPLLLLPFAGMAFAATLSREIIKDMEDAKGDVGRRTLPQTQGFAVATGAARAAAAAALVLSPVPLLSFLPWRSAAGIIYLGLVLAADGLFVLSVARLPRDLHRGQSISKGAMTVALLAFLAVAFR